MKNFFKSAIFFMIIMFLALPFYNINAAEFNSSYIISDQEVFNYDDMSLQQIKDFFAMKNSSLLSYEGIDINGEIKTAAQIIYDTAQKYQINPKFILVMLQKEQSLIETDNPTQKQLEWAMGYGVCDDCSMDDPALLLFKGFGRQVDKAIARFRWYYDNPNVFKTKGVTYEIDGHLVTPANQTTANLYSYTPHIHGNYLFWKIWQRWFKQYYPDGSLVKTPDSSGIYLLEYGLKRPIQSWSAFVSRYLPENILTISQEELDKYENGSPIKFSNYSLLREPQGAIYLLVDDEIRHIDSMETFRMIGFNPDEIENVSAEDLSYYQQSNPITIKSTYPIGALLQDKQNGAVFFVQEGIKHPIIDKEIMEINYPNYRLTITTTAELEKYDDGDPIKLQDGVLIKSSDDPRVYIVANGKKQPIRDEKTFLTLGYKWEKINLVSSEALDILPLGEYVDLSFKE